MAEFIQKPNTGSIFINRDKKAENHPDMRGLVHVDRNLLIDLLSKHKEGMIKLQLAGWKRNTKNGEDYLSLGVSEPYEKPASAGNPWDQQ
jgi:uncharacterized protein (DUF736 family)